MLAQRSASEDGSSKSDWLYPALIDGAYQWLASQREYIARVQGHALRVAAVVIAIVAFAGGKLADKGGDALQWELIPALSLTVLFIAIVGRVLYMSSEGTTNRFALPGVDPIGFLFDMEKNPDWNADRLLMTRLGEAARKNAENLKGYTATWNYGLLTAAATVAAWGFAIFRILN